MALDVYLTQAFIMILQVHEHFIGKNNTKTNEIGTFVIDQHIGSNTEFQVYTMGSKKDNGFIRSISVNDIRQENYAQIFDAHFLEYHFFSVYQVPFDSEKNIGMTWNYEIDKIPVHNDPLEYRVQVISNPRNAEDSLNIKFYTNFASHEIYVNSTSPLKFFVELKLNSIPVNQARVLLKIKVTKHHTSEENVFEMELFDNGNGDPDVKGNDGVYSRYFTNFKAGEGRYDIQIHVDNIEGTAFTYQPMFMRDSNISAARTVKLNSFSRIIKGDSIRIMSLIPEKMLKPSRILDLSAFVLTDKKEVQLSWTAPGEILDHGKVFSYKIFASELSDSFYKRSRKLLMQIAATQISGSFEKFTMTFDQIEQDSFIAIAAINKYEKMSSLSNVVHVKLPHEHFKHDTLQYTSQDPSVKKEQLFHGKDKKSDKVLFYVLFGIIAVLLICIIAVVAILKKYQMKRKRKTNPGSQEDPLEDFDIIDVTDQDMMVPPGSTSTYPNDTKNDITLPTFYKSNISILKNTHNDESLCNCHEVNNDQDLVINPYINYSQHLNINNSSYHNPNHGIYHHTRQEPIYQNHQELYSQQYPIYSVVNKRKDKNVRIVLDNEIDTATTTENEDNDTEEERCLTPSNTYLEVSFDAQQHQNQSKIELPSTPKQALLKLPVHTSTPTASNLKTDKSNLNVSQNNSVNTSLTAKVRTITQV